MYSTLEDFFFRENNNNTIIPKDKNRTANAGRAKLKSFFSNLFAGSLKSTQNQNFTSSCKRFVS